MKMHNSSMLSYRMVGHLPHIKSPGNVIVIVIVNVIVIAIVNVIIKISDESFNKDLEKNYR